MDGPHLDNPSFCLSGTSSAIKESINLHPRLEKREDGMCLWHGQQVKVDPSSSSCGSVGGSMVRQYREKWG